MLSALRRVCTVLYCTVTQKVSFVTCCFVGLIVIDFCVLKIKLALCLSDGLTLFPRARVD